MVIGGQQTWAGLLLFIALRITMSDAEGRGRGCVDQLSDEVKGCDFVFYCRTLGVAVSIAFMVTGVLALLYHPSHLAQAIFAITASVFLLAVEVPTCCLHAECCRTIINLMAFASNFVVRSIFYLM